MTMRHLARGVVAAFACWATFGGCAARPNPEVSPSAGPSAEWVIVRATGGIAALEVVRSIEFSPGGRARWTAFTRRLCGASAECPAFDSATGPLPAAAVARVQAAVREARVASLDPDYGIGPGADRMSTEVSVRIEGQTHRTVGDESTWPLSVQRMVETVSEVVMQARQGAQRERDRIFHASQALHPSSPANSAR